VQTQLRSLDGLVLQIQTLPCERHRGHGSKNQLPCHLGLKELNKWQNTHFASKFCSPQS